MCFYCTWHHENENENVSRDLSVLEKSKYSTTGYTPPPGVAHIKSTNIVPLFYLNNLIFWIFSIFCSHSTVHVGKEYIKFFQNFISWHTHLKKLPSKSLSAHDMLLLQQITSSIPAEPRILPSCTCIVHAHTEPVLFSPQSVIVMCLYSTNWHAHSNSKKNRIRFKSLDWLIFYNFWFCWIISLVV